MSTDVQFRPLRLSLSLLALVTLCLAAASVARAQDEKEPPFHGFKGVAIGMTIADARSHLGNPTDKSDAQDLYSVNDKQTIQVYYDGGKVSAITLMFNNAGADALTPKAVFGSDITEARPDGSMYKLVRYTKAGYFVAYNRTAGNEPVVIVTLQKIR
ncbi:MAG: hypothetical protein QOE33_2453 [Acidobacteriota bacterium]|nr:hypothetical protein [Acidobacteriota bacterium]